MSYLIVFIEVYLGIAVCYYTVFSVAALFRKRQNTTNKFHALNKIAVFIPAYKEDEIIVDTAIQALQQSYHTNMYDVYVIADSLEDKTIFRLNELPVEVVEVSFEKSTKVKAINKTYEVIVQDYEIAVVLDADNVMEEDFLSKINEAYNTGAIAMQGHRIAKNQNNSLATLDAVSEEINNNIFRKGHQNIGLSSALIGSGMAFDFHIFKRLMANIEAIGGFDKELELTLLKRKTKIVYLENAYVYDEKVSRADAFTNQRTRWIAAQIRYGLKSFGNALIHLIIKGNIDYFDKSLQFLLPPRLILLGSLAVISATLIVFQISHWIEFSGMFLLLIGSLLLATPRKFYNKSMLTACLLLPNTFWMMIKALGGYKKAKTNFLHTPHKTV